MVQYIKFDKRTYNHRYELREWSNQRIAAAKRALKKEREKAGLFGEELMRFTSVKERQSQVDTMLIKRFQQFRNDAANDIKEVRSKFKKLPGDVQKDILEYWNNIEMPKAPFRFLSLMHNYEIDPLYFKRLKGEAWPYTQTVIGKDGVLRTIEISQEQSMQGIYLIDKK